MVVEHPQGPLVTGPFLRSQECKEPLMVVGKLVGDMHGRVLQFVVGMGSSS
ncbi:hypothetical protein [Micromonospora ureilytica]|uniref:hypothetical protein n=1 Tax=Micromonospora ureilytica TaxID=709868 RepID=UPI004039CFB6